MESQEGRTEALKWRMRLSEVENWRLDKLLRGEWRGFVDSQEGGT